MKRLRINFLSDGHIVLDDLIYYRYALSLSKNGMDVKIFARSTKFKPESNIVECYGIVPENCSRFLRFSYYSFKLFLFSLLYPADVYIICTPALLLLGLMLKFLLRKKIIYNAQENYQVKFQDRDWIPKAFVGILAKSEKFLGNKMDGIIVTDSISANNYSPMKTISLPNFPTCDDVLENKFPLGNYVKDSKAFNMVYIGGISKNRGLEIFRKLIKKLPENFYIHLYGRFSYKEEEKCISNEKRIFYHGYVEHKKIISKLKEYNLGLCIFENVPAYRYYAENTTKLFEYMKSSLPVVVSNFPGLKKIIEDGKCGIAVDPNDIDETARLIEDLSKDKVKLNELKKNSYNVFLTKYNWNAHEKLLLEFISKISTSST